MKKTKIVCTIGPKTESEEMLAKMLDAGMNVMRLNFSHGDYAEHGQRIQNLRNVMSKTGKTLSPIASVGGDTLRVAGEKYRRTYISGVNEDYMTINNYKVAKGRGIQYTDLIDNKNICVIGDYVDRKIFGGNGLGSTLKVGASEYRIVGVLEGRSKPASQYEGGNDDVVLIPYTTLMSVNNTSSVSQYYVVLQDADHSDEAQEFLQSRLKKLVSLSGFLKSMKTLSLFSSTAVRSTCGMSYRKQKPFLKYGCRVPKVPMQSQTSFSVHTLQAVS